MNVNELMIGDWVKCKDLKCEGHQVDLIDLGNEEVGIDGEYADLESIDPIPLTEETLKKNFPEYEPGYEIGWWPTEDGKYHIELSRDKMVVDMECGVDYVHELQHLLKLCKIDKEIVL